MNEIRILCLLCVLVVAVLLTGCGASKGWRFEIGVAPVDAINNNYSLGRSDEEEGTEVKRK